MNYSVNSGYERYLQLFQESLEAKGYRPSNNKLRDRLLGIPEPMTREQWVENCLEFLMPIAEVGFARKKQSRAWGMRGAKAKKENGKNTSDAVFEAVRKIRSSWRNERTPNTLELAKLVSEKTGMALGTVRHYITKDTWASK